MTLRGRLIALAVTLALLLAAGITVLMRTRTADCTVAAPRPLLPAALRPLGDFDQSYDVSNVPAIEDAAARAASALHADLIGATAEGPVTISATQAGRPDAVVVPLRSHGVTSGGQAPLAGLVVFLRDCQGNAYFDTVEDDASAQPPLLGFPQPGRDQAVAVLGSAGLRLEYDSSPLRPQWTTISGAPRSMPAR
jgi:hypothetical protein